MFVLNIFGGFVVDKSVLTLLTLFPQRTKKSVIVLQF